MDRQELLSPYLCFFFFSSRRRHTRSDRDWSSDVCSSDLLLRSQEVRLLFEEPWRTRLADEDFPALDEDLRRDEAVIRREVRVRQVRAGAAHVRGRDLEVIFLTARIAACLRAVRSHER